MSYSKAIITQNVRGPNSDYETPSTDNRARPRRHAGYRQNCLEANGTEDRGVKERSCKQRPSLLWGPSSHQDAGEGEAEVDAEVDADGPPGQTPSTSREGREAASDTRPIPPELRIHTHLGHRTRAVRGSSRQAGVPAEGLRDTGKVSREEGRGTPGPPFSEDNRSCVKANLTKHTSECRNK